MPKYYPKPSAAGGGKSMIFFKVTNYNINFNLVRYLNFKDPNSTESYCKFVISTAGTIRNLYLACHANTLNGNCVITIRKNGVDTALVLTLGAGVVSGNDSAHSFTVAAGDVISVEIDTSAAGAGNIHSPSVTIEHEPS